MHLYQHVSICICTCSIENKIHYPVTFSSHHRVKLHDVDMKIYNSNYSSIISCNYMYLYWYSNKIDDLNGEPTQLIYNPSLYLFILNILNIQLHNTHCKQRTTCTKPFTPHTFCCQNNKSSDC